MSVQTKTRAWIGVGAVSGNASIRDRVRNASANDRLVEIRDRGHQGHDDRTQTVAIARMLPAKEGCTCIIGCNCVLTNATHMAKVRISIVYAQLGETNA